MPNTRNWTHAAKIAWPILVEVGSRRDTVTYEQLSIPLKTNPLSVGKALGVIQTYCLENRLAPLTAVVVGKTSGVPGTGFIAWDVDDFDAARTKTRWPGASSTIRRAPARSIKKSATVGSYSEFFVARFSRLTAAARCAVSHSKVPSKRPTLFHGETVATTRS